jgi:excisionase family DNA binding protein
MSDRLSKKEVCALLKIGYSTLGRWMRDGKIKFTREQAKNFESAVFFRRDDLAEFLEQPTPAPAPAVVPAPIQAPAPKAPAPDLRTWEEKYRDGDACDSCGNTIDGANDLYPRTGASLLGPVEPVTVPPVNRDTASHMNPALVGYTGGPSANDCYLNSLEYQRDHWGLSQERYDELTANATKARKQCEQQQKVYLDRAAITAAFRHGYSR